MSKNVPTSAKVCCKTMATASNLQLLAARSPLSCWMLWSFVPPSVTLAGTTSGGPLLWFCWHACCFGCCWRELAFGLFLSTVREHVLSVVTTLIIIIPPSITAAAALTAVPPTLYNPVRVTDAASSSVRALDTSAVQNCSVQSV